MERADWLEGGLDAVEARFLMVTAITHHRFSSPIWGEHEVRKLHAELAEIDVLASRAVIDHVHLHGRVGDDARRWWPPRSVRPAGAEEVRSALLRLVSIG